MIATLCEIAKRFCLDIAAGFFLVLAAFAFAHPAARRVQDRPDCGSSSPPDRSPGIVCFGRGQSFSGLREKVAGEAGRLRASP